MRKLHTYLGRLIRDVERKASELSPELEEALRKSWMIYQQQPKDKDKLLSWHAPEVECIGKGKAHKPYEFGCKVSVMTTVNPSQAGHFVLQSAALHGNPYDGHTLKEAIDSYEKLTGATTTNIYVDKGYQGYDKSLKGRVYKTGQKRVPSPLKRELRRRSVIEPVIGHLKNDGLMGRNYLKGRIGDRINAIFSAIGYNFRLLLRWFRNLLAQIMTIIYRLNLLPGGKVFA